MGLDGGPASASASSSPTGVVELWKGRVLQPHCDWPAPRWTERNRKTERPDQPCLRPGRPASIPICVNCFPPPKPEAVTGQRWGLFQGRLEELIRERLQPPARRWFRNFRFPPYGPSCGVSDPWLPLAAGQGGFDCFKARLWSLRMKLSTASEQTSFAGFASMALPDLLGRARARTWIGILTGWWSFSLAGHPALRENGSISAALMAGRRSLCRLWSRGAAPLWSPQDRPGADPTMEGERV